MPQPKKTVGSKLAMPMPMKEFLETQPLYTKMLWVLPAMTVPTLNPGGDPDVLLLHCEICGDTRPFRYPGSSGGGAGRSPEEIKNGHVYVYHFACTGCRKQLFTCWIRVNLTPEKWIEKVGQYPSVATLYSAQIKRYRKVLAIEDYDELRRAVGLAAHGIGIGAFVYLRRIFERLIAEAHQIARQDSAWDEDRFLKSRMPEKIGLLASHLPAFLVENKSLYGILSKGLHELSEDECLQYYSITQHGIELILEEKIATKEKNEKIKQATKDIALLSQKIEGHVDKR